MSCYDNLVSEDDKIEFSWNISSLGQKSCMKCSKSEAGPSFLSGAPGNAVALGTLSGL